MSFGVREDGLFSVRDHATGLAADGDQHDGVDLDEMMLTGILFNDIPGSTQNQVFVSPDLQSLAHTKRPLK